MLIHLWLIMLLIPSILCGDKGGKAKKKTAAPGKKAAKAAKAARAIIDAPAAAVAPVKSAPKRAPIVKSKKGDAFIAPDFSTTPKKRIRIRNRTKTSTAATTPRTRRTTMIKYFTQSWDEQVYGKLEDGILTIHNQNPRNVLIHELTHFIEKDNQTIYKEKYLQLIIGHDVIPKEVGFHVHKSEETKDRWTILLEYLNSNYTIRGGVYYNLKKGDSKHRLYIVIDNGHNCLKIRQSAVGHVANATMTEV